MFVENNSSSVEIGAIASFQTKRVPIKFINRKDYVTTNNMLQNRQGITEYKGVFDKIETAILYEKGDVLVSNIRPYLKKIWLSDREGGCSADVLVFHINDLTKYSPEYIYYALYQDRFFDFMMSEKTGMKMPRSNKKAICKYTVPNVDYSMQNEFVEYVKSIDKLKFE